MHVTVVSIIKYITITIAIVIVKNTIYHYCYYLLFLPLLSSLGRNVFLLIIRVVESDAWSVLLIAKQAFSL